MLSSNSSVRQSVVLDSHAQRMFRMRKGVMTSARLINDRLAADKAVRWVPLMVTLTYKNSDDWKPEHISDFLRRVQKYAKRRGQKLPVVWVMELQKRGAPHYHVLIWIPRRWRLPAADRQGWWSFGSTNVCRVRNAVGYVAKYASKGQAANGAEFPKGARVHGIGGLTGHEAAVVAWWKLPKALRLGEEGSHKWRRCTGGGWRCIAGDSVGLFHASEWGLSSIDSENKRVRIVEKPAYDERIKHLIDTSKELAADVWREVIYHRSVAFSAASSNLLKANRVAWLLRAEAGGLASLGV
jgi:hypothetical protein